MPDGEARLTVATPEAPAAPGSSTVRGVPPRDVRATPTPTGRSVHLSVSRDALSVAPPGGGDTGEPAQEAAVAGEEDVQGQPLGEPGPSGEPAGTSAFMRGRQLIVRSPETTRRIERHLTHSLLQRALRRRR